MHEQCLWLSHSTLLSERQMWLWCTNMRSIRRSEHVMTGGSGDASKLSSHSVRTRTARMFLLLSPPFFPPFPIFTRRHGNQLTSRPTVTHMHRGAWWDTLSALKVIREEYVIISVENCVKPWQNNLKASCETAECPWNAFKMLIKQISHVTQM